MAAGEEAATTFVETSLGTRLAVSFPASTTTVAHLKRIVSEEHAASFPHIGRITLQSFKVRRKGSWYHLTDSMAVRAAFHGIKGTWHLQAHALLLPHSAAPPSLSNVPHHVLCCSQQNTICGHAAASPSDTQSTDQEDEEHDHIDDDDASALAPHVTAGTSSGKCSSGKCAMLGENSDPHVAAHEDGYSALRMAGVTEEEPRGRKHSREEEDENHHQTNHDAAAAALVCSIRHDGQNKCRHDSMPKRICTAREDQLLDEVYANSIRGGRDDVVVLSSDDDMLQDECGLDDLCCQDQGLGFVEMKKEDVVSTRSADQAEPPVEELCNHDTMSLTDDKESNSQNPALCFSVSKNRSTTAAQEHTDEGMEHDKLVEQQDPAPFFSLNKNYSTIAAEEHADEGMEHDKLVEQQDHLDTSAAQVLHNCNSKGDSATHSEYSSDDCHHYEGSSRSFDLKCSNIPESEILADQVGHDDRVCLQVEVTPTERASQEKHDRSVIRCGTVSAAVGEFFYHPTPNSELSAEKVNSTEQDYHESGHLSHDSYECAGGLKEKPFCGQKEPSIAAVCNSASSMKGKYRPPCAESTEEGNSSEKKSMPHKVKGKEPWTAKVCDGERRSKKGTDLPPCVEALKEVNSSEKEGEKKQSTRTVTLVDVDGTKWTMQLDDSDLPPCAKSIKEGNSLEKEEMTHKVMEEEPWTDHPPFAKSTKEGKSSEKEEMSYKCKEEEPWTDHPPFAGAMKEGNSSEKEEVPPNEEKQSTRTVTLVDVDGTKWTMQLDDSFDLGPQESRSSSEAEESYSHSVRPRQNGRPDKVTPGNVGTRVPTERRDLPRHCSFKTPTCNGPTGSKDAEGTSADGAEQGAWDGRRRTRHVVRKIPNSRAAKMYGYR